MSLVVTTSMQFPLRIDGPKKRAYAPGPGEVKRGGIPIWPDPKCSYLLVFANEFPLRLTSPQRDDDLSAPDLHPGASRQGDNRQCRQRLSITRYCSGSWRPTCPKPCGSVTSKRGRSATSIRPGRR